MAIVGRHRLRTFTSQPGEQQQQQQESEPESKQMSFATKLWIGTLVVASGTATVYFGQQYLEPYIPWKTGQQGMQHTASNSDEQEELRFAAFGVAADTQEQLEFAYSNPGLFAWGSNAHGVTGNSNVSGSVQRQQGYQLPGLENQLLRCVSLGESHAAAIDIDGNLIQWGDCGESEPSVANPRLALVGQNLTQVAVTDQHVYALTSKGQIVVLDASPATQQQRTIDSIIKPDAQLSTVGTTPSSSPITVSGHKVDTIREKLFGWWRSNASKSGDSDDAEFELKIHIPWTSLKDSPLYSIFVQQDDDDDVLDATSAGAEFDKVPSKQSISHVTTAAGGRSTWTSWWSGAVSWLPFFTSDQHPDIPASGSPARVASFGSNLAKGEIITSIDAGSKHAVALTNKGRVFIAQLPSTDANSEIDLLESAAAFKPVQYLSGSSGGSSVQQISCGSNHTVALTQDGRVYGFGGNEWGQLAQGEFKRSAVHFDEPVRIYIPDSVSSNSSSASNTTSKKRSKTQRGGIATADVSSGTESSGSSAAIPVKIAAGGNNTFVVVEQPHSERTGVRELAVYSSGNGRYGQLGNGTFQHLQGNMVRVSTISGLLEYSETERKLVPVPITSLKVAGTHAFAIVRSQESTTSARPDASGSTTGAVGDVFGWGRNIDGEVDPLRKTGQLSKPQRVSSLLALNESLQSKDTNKDDSDTSLSKLQLAPRQRYLVTREIPINGPNGTTVIEQQSRAVTIEQDIAVGPSTTAVYLRVVEDS
ncbi:RCC1/BLIP-II [Ramicandelaber brevisporus]|nr:RCC1/BLIP-II [Ramicandelaber brevisporus]